MFLGNLRKTTPLITTILSTVVYFLYKNRNCYRYGEHHANVDSMIESTYAKIKNSLLETIVLQYLIHTKNNQLEAFTTNIATKSVLCELRADLTLKLNL